jgi:hypothetical protein
MLLNVPNRIYLYWHQGWRGAPRLQQACRNTWINLNPKWEINCLDARNVDKLVTLPVYARALERASLTALSDVIRIHLLSEYGGVWVDSTTWCMRELDHWLDEAMARARFFAYDRPAADRPLASWFLASSTDNYIATTWRRATDTFWTENLESLASGNFDKSLRIGQKDYFWFHSLFGQLLESDDHFARCWRDVPKLSADGAHFLQNQGLLTEPTDNVKQHIRNKMAAVYKLDSRINIPEQLDNTILGALFSTYSENGQPIGR